MIDRIPVPTPGAGIDEFEIKIHIGRDVITDAQSGHLLNERIVGVACEVVGYSQRVVTVSSVSNPSAETEIVPVFRTDAKVCADPEIFEVKIPADVRIEELVLLLEGNASADDDDIGDSFAFRYFEGRIDDRGGGQEEGWADRNGEYEGAYAEALVPGMGPEPGVPPVSGLEKKREKQSHVTVVP